MKRRKQPASWLHKRAKRGFRGYPIATMAFYGPTAELATKVVVSIVRDEGHEPDPLERWFSEDTDVRASPAIGEKVFAFLKEHAAKSVIVTDGIIGCPHEEGIDYPEGKSCAHSAPTGLAVTASLASASNEPRTPRRYVFSSSCSCLFSVSQRRAPLRRSTAPEIS